MSKFDNFRFRSIAAVPAVVLMLAGTTACSSSGEDATPKSTVTVTTAEDATTTPTSNTTPSESTTTTAPCVKSRSVKVLLSGPVALEDSDFDGVIDTVRVLMESPLGAHAVDRPDEVLAATGKLSSDGAISVRASIGSTGDGIGYSKFLDRIDLTIKGTDDEGDGKKRIDGIEVSEMLPAMTEDGVERLLDRHIQELSPGEITGDESPRGDDGFTFISRSVSIGRGSNPEIATYNEVKDVFCNN
jgi:hypothetical protein